MSVKLENEDDDLYSDDSFLREGSNLSGVELNEATYLGDDPSRSESSCCGRYWQWIRPNVGNLAVRGVLAAASVASTVWLTIYAVKDFVQDETNHSIAMGYGAGIGLSTTVLAGSLLPSNPATILADWIARWSYEGLQMLTQFYLNAGCPIDGNGFWDTENVPPAIRELAMMIFTGVSAHIALLSLRNLVTKLFCPNEKVRPIPINEDGDDDEIVYEQHPTEPIPMLEAGKDDPDCCINGKTWLITEQVVKGVLGVGLMTLQRTNVLAAPEWFYIGSYLAGHVGGVVLGKGYQALRDRVSWCPTQESKLDTVNKLGRLFRIVGYGICFGWANQGSFALLGLIGGTSKIMSLRNFELLTKNDENVKDFNWCIIENVVKAPFVGLFLAWYISGMTDKGLQIQDYVNICTYLATSLITYPATRYLAANFEPRQNNRVFNTLRFYFVNHNQVLILPYMLVRSAQSIGDNIKNPTWLTMLQEFVAWASLGTATGNNRALMGIRSDTSPTEVSSLALLNAIFILGSRGRFR